INNYYFNLRIRDKIKEINDKLNQISKKYNIQILSKQDFQCQIKKKICYGSTDEGIKIYWDTTHFTLEGAKFFGKKIYDLNWLKID
ncbi:SGNH hydrolase domain-containing protein, partial [Candidatus Pelagibacter sp.]|nr:SGNH hydrolase domain-containing protein [Candidatus Pelagibacter sp.]